MRLLIVSICAALYCSSAAAAPRDEALAVIERWATAFTASDVDAIVALYAPDATFVGTSSTNVVTDTDDVRAYFERALLSNRPRSAALDEHEVVVLSPTTVLVTGLDTVTSVRNGEPVRAHGRVTFVVVQQGAEWRIAHFHRSAMPS